MAHQGRRFTKLLSKIESYFPYRKMFIWVMVDPFDLAAASVHVRPMLPAHCRAARALLRWTQEELAKRSGVSVVTIRNFENEKSEPQRGTLLLLRQCLEAAGVDLIPENGGGVGVRLRRRGGEKPV